jgi:hypothetical protein
VDIVVLANRYKVHHFRSLEAQLAGRFEYEETLNPEAILAHRPALVICFDEHYCELANLIATVKENGVATLQVMDGILEWRRTWDYVREGHPVDGVVLPLNQPVLSDKIACLGRRDARIMESWGNFGKCEIVGAPRMDGLVERRLSGKIPEVRPIGRKLRILVMTAKTPGFTESQVRITTGALRDLKKYFDQRNDIDVVWRLTADLDRTLGTHNNLVDLAGTELHELLEQVDAVITTPSTSMLESMLLNRPVALLDYFNIPHYFEAAWSISCEQQIPQVVEELLEPPPHRFDFQQFLLEEQLACKAAASGRLIRLIEEMLRAKESSSKQKVEYPLRILNDQNLFFNSELPLSDLQRYYPSFPVPSDMAMREKSVELAAARGTILLLGQKVEFLVKRLESIPGYTLLRKVKKFVRGIRW